MRDQKMKSPSWGMSSFRTAIAVFITLASAAGCVNPEIRKTSPDVFNDLFPCSVTARVSGDEAIITNGKSHKGEKIENGSIVLVAWTGEFSESGALVYTTSGKLGFVNKKNLAFRKTEDQLTAQVSECHSISAFKNKRCLSSQCDFFEVIDKQSPCAFVLARQNSNFILLEKYQCSAIDKNERGYGDISKTGVSHILIKNRECEIKVIDHFIDIQTATDALKKRCGD